MKAPRLIRAPLALVQLAPNPRPRDSIDAAGIDELAETILQTGIIQPPLAREDSADGYEVYIGQRRYLGQHRAIDLATERGVAPEVIDDLRFIPLIVREVDDKTMLEMQWIENLQRKDVSPRDEAAGYSYLITQGYAVSDIAAKIGRHASYVSKRLSLQYVPQNLWKAHEKGLVPVSVLELVGPLRLPEITAAVAHDILKPDFKDSPLNYAETDALIKAKYLKNLQGCGWDKKDAELVPVLKDAEGNRIHGGDCHSCPFRGANRDQVPAPAAAGSGAGNRAGESPLRCYNVSCFNDKQQAWWMVLKGNFEANGRTVLDVDRSEEIFEPDGARRLKPSTGYVDLSAKPTHAETGHHSEERSPDWEELHKGTEAMKNAIIARHPDTLRVHYLLPRETAIALAIEADPAAADLFKNRPQAAKVKPVDALPLPAPAPLAAETPEEELALDTESKDTPAPASASPAPVSAPLPASAPRNLAAIKDKLFTRLCYEGLEEALRRNADFPGEAFESALVRIAFMLTPPTGIVHVLACYNASVPAGTKDMQLLWSIMEPVLTQRPDEAYNVLVLLLIACEVDIAKGFLAAPSTGTIAQALKLSLPALHDQALAQSAELAPVPSPAPSSQVKAAPAPELTAEEEEEVYRAEMPLNDEEEEEEEDDEPMDLETRLEGAFADADQEKTLLKEWDALKKPSRTDKDLMKTWNAARMRIIRAAKKLGLELPAKQ